MKDYQKFEESKRLFDFAKHESIITNAAKDDWDKASLGKLDHDKRSTIKNITAVQLACFSSLMEGDLKLARNEEWVPLDVVRQGLENMSPNREDPPVQTLMYQIGYDAEEDKVQFFQELPIRREFLSFNLWNNDPNRLLLQTSVHIDNVLALEAGDRLDKYLKERSPPDECGTGSVFETQYQLEISRLQSDLGRSKESRHLTKCETARFIGCIAETVRSLLASWAENNQDLTCNAEGWKANVASFDFKFKCSNQLVSAFAELQKVEGRGRDKHIRNLYMRLVWETQSYLQSKVVAEISQDARKSPFLIFLFILGFPSLKIEENQDRCSWEMNDGDSAIEFQETCAVTPIGGPQKVKAILKFDEKSKKVSAMFSAESQVFNWQNWKDAFMARLSAQKHWRLTRLFSKHEDLREEACDSDISSQVEHITTDELGLRHDLTYWAGWPAHTVQIVQFEMRKLCKFYNSRFDRFPSYEDCDPHRFVKYIGNLHAAMDKVGSKVQSLYDEGIKVLDEGLVEEALRIFGLCIAAHGSADALKQAVDVVLSKNPVSTSHVLSVMSKMTAWFQVLVNRPNSTALHSDEIDLQMLAHYFGRFYESTRNADALKWKVLALFHTNGPYKPVNEEAIAASESFIISEAGNEFRSHLAGYLIIAYQSHFHDSGDARKQQLAAQYMMRLGTLEWTKNEPLLVSVGHLLEKGYFVSRDEDRKNVLLSFMFKHGGWGDTERMRTMFERLFVNTRVTDESRRIVGFHQRQSTFGIGERPKDAIEMYKALTLKADGSNQIYFGQSLNRLGLLYHKGAKGVQSIESEAHRWYTMAIEQENEDARCNMGVLEYRNSDESHDRLSYLQQAVAHSSSTAMNNLAVDYEFGTEFGTGVRPDPSKAEKLYKDAVELENLVAMYNLALFYKSGYTRFQSEENYIEADKLITRLCNSDLTGLFSLKAQIAKLTDGRQIEQEIQTRQTRHTEFEELGDCLAYLKIL